MGVLVYGTACLLELVHKLKSTSLLNRETFDISIQAANVNKRKYYLKSNCSFFTFHTK